MKLNSRKLLKDTEIHKIKNDKQTNKKPHLKKKMKANIIGKFTS